MDPADALPPMPHTTTKAKAREELVFGQYFMKDSQIDGARDSGEESSGVTGGDGSATKLEAGAGARRDGGRSQLHIGW